MGELVACSDKKAWNQHVGKRDMHEWFSHDKINWYENSFYSYKGF